MSYDPAKVEDWVVGSSGFWRKGDVATGRWIVPFTGTWEQVKQRCDEMRAMEMRHGDERQALEEKQRAELKMFFPEA